MQLCEYVVVTHCLFALHKEACLNVWRAGKSEVVARGRVRCEPSLHARSDRVSSAVSRSATQVCAINERHFAALKFVNGGMRCGYSVPDDGVDNVDEVKVRQRVRAATGDLFEERDDAPQCRCTRRGQLGRAARV